MNNINQKKQILTSQKKVSSRSLSANEVIDILVELCDEVEQLNAKCKYDISVKLKVIYEG